MLHDCLALTVSVTCAAISSLNYWLILFLWVFKGR